MKTIAQYYRWRWRPGLRKNSYQILQGLFRGLSGIFPALMRLSMRSAVAVKRRMDYDRADIYLSVESWIEYEKRTQSCSKEPETIQWIHEHIKAGDVVFDIGANIGAYSLVIDKHLNGNGRVYAFEPSFSTFAQLSRNVALNDASRTVYPMYIALSDTTGIQFFNYSSIETGTALHALSATSEGGAEGSFNAVHRQPILGYTMDDFIKVFDIPNPNHVKLDVDGIEYAILSGAKDVLSSAGMKTVIVETEETRDGSDKITTLLESLGYRKESEHVHNDNPFHPGPYVRNCIFVKA